METLSWILAGLALLAIVAWWRERSLRARELRRLRELGDKREAMRRCLEFLQEGVILLGPEEEVLYANPAAAALLGFASPPRSGEHPTLRSLAPSTALHAFLEDSTPEASRREVLELDSLAEQASPVQLEVTLAEAGLARRLLVLRDVQEAEQVNRKRQDFVANASHELKTPIAALIGLLDLLDLVPTEKREDLLERARRNARGLANMAEDLLSLARAEAGEWQPHPRMLAVEEEIERVLESQRESAANKNLQLEVAIADAARELWLDPFALRTILQNLVGNAIAYTAEGHVRLTADLTADGARLLLEVSDTGPGIDPEIQPRIFERFFRGDTAHSRASGGTGLGLSIVNHLVKRVDGRLSLQSVPGEGATFRVELPCRMP